uniref:Uncharacterized protein n=1 Tax=Romanomermis culicivorax TaxID=13658 RepID=A0A915I3N3_ROMCU
MSKKSKLMKPIMPPTRIVRFTYIRICSVTSTSVTNSHFPRQSTLTLPTMASAQASTTEELLNRPILASSHELSDDELFETPIFDLNIAKLPPDVIMSSPTGPPTAADLTVPETSINEFLKLMLDDISTLAPVSVEMTIPVHQPKMDTKEAMNTADKTLTDMPEETTADAETLINVVPPAVDPSIYLATPMALPNPRMITTIGPYKVDGIHEKEIFEIYGCQS